MAPASIETRRRRPALAGAATALAVAAMAGVAFHWWQTEGVAPEPKAPVRTFLEPLEAREDAVRKAAEELRRAATTGHLKPQEQSAPNPTEGVRP